MRTTIEIDDELMSEAMAMTGTGSISATVEQALRLLIRRGRQERIRAYRGRLPCDRPVEEFPRDD